MSGPGPVDVEIRAVGDDDAGALAGLWRDTERYYALPQADPAVEARAFKRLAAPGDPSALVAFVDGAPAGYLVYAIVLPPLQGAMFVKELFVLETMRGARVGRALMAAAARLAAELGCARLDLTTDQANHGARSFYERIGGDLRSDKVCYRFERDALARLAREA